MKIGLEIKTPRMPNYLQPQDGGPSIAVASLTKDEAKTIGAEMASAFYAHWEAKQEK